MTDGPPPTDGPDDEGNVEEGPATSGGPVCETQDWTASQCGWVEANDWWGCGGGGQCGPNDTPILCPDGFTEMSICSEVGVDPLQGCCTADGNEAFCAGAGTTATINECPSGGTATSG